MSRSRACDPGHSYPTSLRPVLPIRRRSTPFVSSGSLKSRNAAQSVAHGEYIPILACAKDGIMSVNFRADRLKRTTLPR